MQPKNPGLGIGRHSCFVLEPNQSHQNAGRKRIGDLYRSRHSCSHCCTGVQGYLHNILIGSVI